MDNLLAVSPCAGLLPMTIGALSVAELDMDQVTSVTPFSGVSADALVRALGMAFPKPLQTVTDGDARLVWVGRGEALLIGRAPDAGLGAHAAVVDQSDAWAFMTLTGTGGADVLARLVPVDMRLSAFGVGATVRSQMGHMNASITRLDNDAFMIAVFRSMAGTLVHDLRRALEAVAAPAVAATAKGKDCGYQADVVAAVQAARVARIGERKVPEYVAKTDPEWPEKYNSVIPLVAPWVYGMKMGEVRSADLGAAWNEMCLSQ